MRQPVSDEHEATVALVWSFVLAPVGLVLSLRALRKIRAGQGSGLGLARLAFWNSATGLFTGAVLIACVWWWLVSGDGLNAVEGLFVTP